MPRELRAALELEALARRYGTTPWDVYSNAPAWIRRHVRLVDLGVKDGG